MECFMVNAVVCYDVDLMSFMGVCFCIFVSGVLLASFPSMDFDTPMLRGEWHSSVYIEQTRPSGLML